MDLRAAFRDQAISCEKLGSPFMARLMGLAAERLEPGTVVADRLLGWSGELSSRGQSVPLRLAGALHALRRAGDAGLAAVYPPVEASDEALWGAIATAFVTHPDELMAWLDSPPQTNEVRRSAALIPALHMLASRFGLSLRLSELGCAAGLNLRADQFHLRAGAQSYGPAGSRVQLIPDWQGAAPEPAAINVVGRAGVDLRPIDPKRDAAKLYAYLWPDQPERIALTRAATEIASENFAAISQGEAETWLEAALAAPRPGEIHVVYHTVAWQYFPVESQRRGAMAFDEAGARASESAPLARLAMEADDGRGAAVTLQVWPQGETYDLARADFHGRWIDWRIPCLTP